MNQPTRKPASNASPAPVVSVAAMRLVATSKPNALAARSAASTVAPFGPRLMTATGASSSSPSRTAPPRSASASAAVANRRSGAGVADQRARRPAAVGQQRPDRREVDADRAHPRRAPGRSPAGPPRRAARRAASRPAGGGRSAPANHAARRSPGASRSAAPRSATKRPLAAGRDEDADPPGACPGDARHARTVTPSPRMRLDQRPAGGIASDRRDEARSGPEPGEPARRVGRRAALAERDPARHVGADVERRVRRQDDVEHQVAEHDDPDRAAARVDRRSVAGGRAVPVDAVARGAAQTA